MDKPSSHFEGQSAVEHLKKARLKGFMASREVHGAELSGFFSSFTDALKESSVILILLSLLVQEEKAFLVFIVFALAFTLWKAGRSAFLGWSRIERLHRLIEEERYEIQHHRQQEKEELREIYKAKGLSDKLVNDVVDSLMSDDNRLLQVMLEEELGLTLETYEHPLSQALGAFLGVVLSSLIFILSYLLIPGYSYLLLPALLIVFASAFYAKKEKNNVLSAIVWSLAISFLSIAFGYFFLKIVK